MGGRKKEINTEMWREVGRGRGEKKVEGRKKGKVGTGEEREKED